MKSINAAAMIIAASLLLASCGASPEESSKDTTDETAVMSSQDISRQDTSGGQEEESAAGSGSAGESGSEDETGGVVETESADVPDDTESADGSEEADVPDETAVPDRPGRPDESIELIPFEGDVNEGFIGTWNRTNVHSGHRAVIDITSVSNDTFGGIEGTFLHFTGDFQYYANTGAIEGEALFISENEAVYTYWDALEDPNATYDTYVFFELDEDGLHVDLQGRLGMLGMGHNVYPTGDFITGEPSYTNANIIDELFTSDELDQLRELLGEQTYNEQFIYLTSGGGVMEGPVILSDGTPADCITSFIPGAGTGYQLLITEDGKIYYSYYESFADASSEDGIITNDPDFEGTGFPEFTLE